MATGIIQVFAQSGYPVTYIARSQDKVDAVRAAIEKSLAKAVERSKTTQEDADAVLGPVVRDRATDGDGTPALLGLASLLDQGLGTGSTALRCLLLRHGAEDRAGS